MIIFRSALFFIFFLFWGVFIGIAGSITLLTFNPRIVVYVGFIWTRVAIFAQRIICNVKVEVRGVENLPEKPFIIASKHQSAWETLYFARFFVNAIFIIKRELLYIPLYGWYLPLAGMIYINRGKGVQAIKQIIEGVKKAAHRKQVVCMFPEGTRTSIHEKPQIKSGIAAIHSALPDLPIVPVALNSGKIWPSKSWLIKPGVITIKFLPVVRKTDNKDELLQKLQDAINSDPTL